MVKLCRVVFCGLPSGHGKLLLRSRGEKGKGKGKKMK